MTEFFDLAWAAGIFDGEGSVFLTRNIPRGGRGGINDRLTVKVTNTDVRMVQKLHAMAGGRIAMPGLRDGRRQAWEWVITNRPAQDFLRSIRPFLVVKGEQVDVALEFTTGVRGGGRGHKLNPAEDARRDEIQRRLRVLKREEVG